MNARIRLIASHEETTDEELMLAYQKGDNDAFETLFSRYQREIYNFITRFLGNAQSAEEAFQEVFERVMRSANSYIPQARFSTWLYTIARNYCIDTFRKKKLHKTVSLDESFANAEEGNGSRLGDKIPDGAPSPDQEVGGMELSEKLLIALQRINPDQREVFLLREKQGLPFDEISKIIGVSINTVKSRMRYALVALQEEFKKLGITDPK